MAFVSRQPFAGVKSGMANSMPFEIQIIPNPVILVGEMEGLSARISSARKPLERAIKEVVIPSINQNFAAEGRPEGWDQLVQNTVSQREELGFGGEHPILQRTTKLYKAATAFARWKIVKDQAYVDNWPQSVWYGPVHQGGAVYSTDSFGDVGIPARPFMMIQDPQDVDDIEKVFDRWLGENLAQAGFVVT